METKKKKLSTSLVAAIVIFTVLLSLSLGLIGYQTYYQGMIKEYQKYEDTILNLAVSDFDWDAVRTAVEKQDADASVLTALRSRLDHIKRSSKIAWLYMVEPLNDSATDNMRYITAGHTEEDYQIYGVTPLGKLTGNEYPAEVARQYLDFYRTSQPGACWYYPNKTEWGWTYTASVVVRDSAGKALGVMGVDIYMVEIDRVLQIFPLVILLASAVLSALFIFALSVWLNRRVVHPLSRLQHAAKLFVESSHGSSDPAALDFANPDIHTADEMESLSAALVTMAADLKSYMKNLLHETAEKERIGAELNVATKIQAEMLPIIFPPFPDRKEVDIYASMTPAKEVGGDFYDFFMVDERHLAIVVADVSGKGVPAALFMVIGKTLIKDHTVPGADPAEVFEKVNNLLCESNGEELFITAFLGILDLVTGEFKCVSAGHEPPYIFHNGTYVEHKIKKAFVLAGMENMKYTTVTLQLEPGDKVFQYTDGVTEATDAHEQLYGDERLGASLNKIGGVSAKELLSGVKADIDRFVCSAPQFDDITMLCLEYKERMKV
ncbi:MAG: SpoIIE family protein phosphatase [Treponema sp.]|nr:SpoIIE family protein phosphatase [Treponema sp.]